MKVNVTFQTRKFKNEYFKKLFDKNLNNTTLIWKRIRQLITRKSKIKVDPNIVNIKDKDITNSTEIFL